MSATNRKFHICDGGVNDETLTNVDFGWSWDDIAGSGFAFRSVDYGSEENAERGAFIMWARDASNSYSLTGKCDGTLTWSGPAPTTSDNSNKIATTAYVKAQNYATLASPALTGTPTAPTAAVSTNNTQIATTAYVKNQNYITSNDYARLKSCMVMQSSSTSTNPWYKVCSVLCNGVNWDPQITFLVEETYGSHNFGILRLHLRTNGNKILDTNASTIKWLINSGFTTNQFVLVLPTASSSTAELWTSIPAAWVGRRFSVLSEGTRTDAYQNNWTLYNASSAGQAASITTSGTQIVSS